MFSKNKKDTAVRRPQIPRGKNTQVFSYRANRSGNPTNTGRGTEAPKASRSSQNHWWHNIPTILAVVVIGACLVYVTLLTPNAKVVIQDQPGAKEELRSLDIYKTATTKLLGTWTSRNKLTINTDKIAEKLKTQFPELSDVSVAVPLIGQRPVVTLQPVQPTLIISGNGGLFVVDKQGKVIARTSDLPNVSKSLSTVIDQSGLEIKVGQRVLPEESVAFITTFSGQLRAKKIAISNLILPPAADELDIRITGQTYLIKTNLAGDARQQAGTFLAAKDKFEADKTIPGELVDTRVEERVYYK